jgi:hypothetical protein
VVVVLHRHKILRHLPLPRRHTLASVDVFVMEKVKERNG